MRLWDYRLLEYLPKSQLLAQWRELNSIFKKQDKHILINYIYNYDKSYLQTYASIVINELENRNYKIKNWDNFNKYFTQQEIPATNKIFNEHNNEYLTICYYNLKEKYLRGQKDFTKDVWEKLDNFYQNEIKGGKT